MPTLSENFLSNAKQRAKTWTFRQLGGEKLTLELAGHAAPHGRPRRGTVVSRGHKIATATVHYAEGFKTRHEFGDRPQPIELSGRWDDVYGGPGFANDMRSRADNFVAGKQQVAIGWGGVLSAIGFIDELILKDEGHSATVWTMKIDIDVDNSFYRPSPQKDPRNPRDYTAQILAALAPAAGFTELPHLTGSLFDSLNGFLASLNNVSAQLNNLTGQLASWINAPFDLLWKIRATIGQFRTVVVNMHTAADDLTAELALERQMAHDKLGFWGWQSSFSAGCYETMHRMAEMDRRAAMAQRDQIRGAYMVRGGDTWESIAANPNVLGDAGRADDLRKMNGAVAGKPPVPGSALFVPR